MKGFLLIVVVVGTASACKFPPSLWCSSPEIARKCKVYDQCKESVWTLKTKAEAVDIELYYESLCPDCRQFITKQLFPTWGKVDDIMNLTLVPFGNAQEKQVGDRWEFTCQHGQLECIGNLLETCAIYVLKDIKKIMPFINCMELSDDPNESVKSCAAKQGVPLNEILACFNTTVGNQLEHQMAVKTEALHPRHKYVPWIVLNGVHTEKMNDEAVSDLLKLVCDTYTGPTPPACSNAKTRSIHLRKDLH